MAAVSDDTRSSWIRAGVGDMFGRGKKQLKSEAAAIEAPQSTIVHNYNQISWPGIIVVAFICLLAVFPVLWWILVFLFGEMGYYRPEKAAAEFVMIVVLLPLGFGILWFAAHIVSGFLNRIFLHSEEMERIRLELEKTKLLAASAAIEPDRMNRTDYDFAKVIVAVMMSAYEWREKNGATFPGRWRPWSLDSSLQTARKIGVKITNDKANEVSKWLYDRGVITSPDGGQITNAYQDLLSVRTMINREFGRPIQVVSPTVIDNAGYVHISKT